MVRVDVWLESGSTSGNDYGCSDDGRVRFIFGIRVELDLSLHLWVGSGSVSGLGLN